MVLDNYSFIICVSRVTHIIWVDSVVVSLCILHGDFIEAPPLVSQPLTRQEFFRHFIHLIFYPTGLLTTRLTHNKLQWCAGLIKYISFSLSLISKYLKFKLISYLSRVKERRENISSHYRFEELINFMVKIRNMILKANL